MSTESGANKDAGRQSTDPKIVLQVIWQLWVQTSEKACERNHNIYIDKAYLAAVLHVSTKH